MRYCRECGIPKAFGRFLEWTSDGTIIGRDLKRTRVVFLEVDEIRSLFIGVSERIGLDIDRMVYLAEKEVGRRFAGEVVPSIVTRIPRNRITRPKWAVRLSSIVTFSYMAALGMGRADVEDYHSGKSTTFLLKNPSWAPLVVGDGAGFFEYMERVGVEAEWEEAGKAEVSVTLKRTGKTAVEASLDLAEPVYIPGRVEHERCPRCGVPIKLSVNLDWQMDRGIIRNRRTGAREVVMPTQSFFAVFQYLTREVGEEVPQLMEEVEREEIRDSSGVRRYVDECGGIGHLYSDFTWRGIGNPTKADEGADGTTVTVENPFHPGMAAGRIIGLYEAWIDGRVKPDWAEGRPGRLKVEMKRAIGEG